MQRAATKSGKPFILPPDPLMDDAGQSWPLAAWYWYFDELGKPVEWVFRYERMSADGEKHKTFRQARVTADGLGEWKLGPDFRRVLYRLPELLESDPEEIVWITEGEKGVERLASLGLVATSSPEGAGKWGQVQEAPQWLTGRHIIVLEDNDQAGRDHTAKITASLENVANSIRVVRFADMSEHSDVSDWLDAGGDVAELPGMAQPVKPEDSADTQLVRRLKEENAALKEANRRMNAKLDRIYEIAAYEHLKDGPKIAAIVLLREAEKDHSHEADPAGYVPFYREPLAKKAAQSAPTFRNNLDRCEEVGLVHIRTIKHTKPNGQHATQLYYRVQKTEPREWTAPENERKQGGLQKGAFGRPTCTDCGSPDLESKLETLTITKTYKRKIVHLVCTNCGCQQSSEQQGEDLLVSERIEPESPADTQLVRRSEQLKSNEPTLETEPQTRLLPHISLLLPQTDARYTRAVDQRDEAG